MIFKLDIMMFKNYGVSDNEARYDQKEDHSNTTTELNHPQYPLELPHTTSTVPDALDRTT